MYNEYYEILGVTPDDDDEYINQRWRELSQMWHPDKCGKLNACTDERRKIFTEQQRKINEARDMLKGRKNNPNSRKSNRDTRTPSHSRGSTPTWQSYTNWRYNDDQVEWIIRIIEILSVYMVLKAILSRNRQFFTSSRIGIVLSVSASLSLIYLLRESEHIFIIICCVSPLYAYFVYDLMYDFVSMVLSHWVVILALPVMLTKLPRMSIIAIWLCILRYAWKKYDIRVLLLLTGLCWWLISIPSLSLPIWLPVQNLQSEFILLRVFAYVTVLVNILRDPTIQSFSVPLYACLDSMDCSSDKLTHLSQTILHKSPDVLRDKCMPYVAHVLVGLLVCYLGASFLTTVRNYFDSWRDWLVGRLPRQGRHCEEEDTSLGSVGSQDSDGDGPPENAFIDENQMLASRGSRSRDSYDDTASLSGGAVDSVMSSVPGLSRRDAAMYLRERHNDVDETISFLLSPAGKASRAAQLRLKKISYSASTSSTASRRPHRPVPPPSIRL